MKALITGGLGFIGSNLTIRLLESGYDVTILDNLSNGQKFFLESVSNSPKLKIIIGDIHDKSILRFAMNEIDIVFHLSANSDIAKSAVDTMIDIKQTILATHGVLEAMREVGTKRIVYTSGSGVYGDLGNIAPEENYGPLKPVSLYGATKLSAESLISAYVDLYQYNATIFRFANVVGINQTHGVCYDFIRKLKKDSSSLNVLGNGTQFKSYVLVDDIINAVLIATTGQQTNYEAYNVSNIDGITVKEIAEIAVEKIGYDSKIISYGISNQGWAGDVPLVLLNDNKIRKLGWSQQYNSKQAIDNSLTHILNQYDKFNRQ